MPTTDTTRPVTTDLGDQLVRVVKLLTVARQRQPRQHPLVDPMAYPLLHHLAQGPMRVSALAEAVHADVSTVSRQVSTLVDLGFVERGPDPEDRRAHALSIGESGLGLLADIRAGRDRWLRQLLTGWTDDDVRDLTGHLARLAGDLETHLTTTTQRDDA